jgi:hypothetical protein
MDSKIKCLLFITSFLFVTATNSIASSDTVNLKLESDMVRINNAEQTLSVSLSGLKFIFDKAGSVKTDKSYTVNGNLETGKQVEVSFRPISLNKRSKLEVKLFLQWSPKEAVLRKWSRFRLTDSDAPVTLKEIVLEEIDKKSLIRELERGEKTPQSYPAFIRGFFAGIEFPIATTRVEGEKLILSHSPGLKLQPNVWYESRKAVYGAVPPGSEKKAFTEYITSHRPKPRGIHINYNCAWTIVPAFTPCVDNILELIRILKANVCTPYEVSFDTFCIDMGWTDRQSIWEINTRKFPGGFKRVQSALEKINSKLGIWVSPASHYDPAMDKKWAQEHGYETFPGPLMGPPGNRKPVTLCCMAGKNYRTKFRQNIVDMVRRYDIGHIKFDAYVFTCPNSNHGHEPGLFSAEAVAEGLIESLKAIRKTAPDIWLEPINFGTNPSPWWLFYFNSTMISWGDDAPYGRVPCPIYRESCTTARDYYNLQSASSSVPIAAQTVIGVIHQSPDAFLNDAVTVVMRGHAFLPLYINHKYMDEHRWRMLADLVKWARKNFPVLEHTQFILPESWQNGKQPKFSYGEMMPREPYGYAHWNDDMVLIEIRNPWIAPQSFTLNLDESIGLSSQAKSLSAVSLYPEARNYGKNLRFDGSIDIPLAPYETLVLSIASVQQNVKLPSAKEVICNQIETTVTKRELNIIEFEKYRDWLEPNLAALLKDNSSAIHLNIEAGVSITSPEAQLLVLLENDKKSLEEPVYKLKINNRNTSLKTNSCEEGWDMTWVSSRPGYWLFLQTLLPRGKNQISLELFSGLECSRISVWVWATKSGETDSSFPNSLPVPELISLDASALLQPTETATILTVDAEP